MGRINKVSAAHGKIIAKNTQLYNKNKQAMSRVKGSLDILTQSQGRYARSSVRRLTTLNSEWRKHGQVVRAQQARLRAGGFGRAAMGAGVVASRRGGKAGGRGGGLAGMATGVGGGFFLSNVLGTATDFAQNMNTIEAFGSGLDLDVMKRKAIEWGNTTQHSAIQVSGAMAEAAKNNMSQVEILAAMPGNLALASAGQMDLVEAMKLSTDVVNQFGRAHTNLQVADYLAAGSKSPSTIYEIGAALQNVGMQAHQAGIPLKTTVKMLMAMGETGLRGARGGTMLAQMFQQMKQMTPKLQKAFKVFFKGTGAQLSDIFNVETKQFLDPDKFIRLLMDADKKQMGALTTAMESRGGRAVASIASLSDESLVKYTNILENAEGAAERVKLIMMKGLPGALKLFESALETARLVMIDTFVVKISKALKATAKFLTYLAKNHKWVLQTALAVVVLVTAMGLLGIAAWAVAGTWANLILLGGGLKTAVFFLGRMFLITTWKAWLLNTMIFTFTGVAKAAAFAVTLFKGAMWLLNAAFWANPITWIIAAVIALIALFVVAYHKTGSLSNAFIFMGGIMIKSVLEPINLIISAFRGLFWLMSKIPGATGKAFKTAHESSGVLQDRLNMFAGGNKTQSVVTYIKEMWNKGDKSSTWMTEYQRQEGGKRSEYVTEHIGETEGYKKPTFLSNLFGMGGVPSLDAVPGIADYMPDVSSTKGDYMEQMTKQAAAMKTEITVKPVEVKGIIRVIAEKGTKIVSESFTANTGGNMYTLGGVH